MHADPPITGAPDPYREGDQPRSRFETPTHHRKFTAGGHRARQAAPVVNEKRAAALIVPCGHKGPARPVTCTFPQVSLSSGNLMSGSRSNGPRRSERAWKDLRISGTRPSSPSSPWGTRTVSWSST